MSKEKDEAADLRDIMAEERSRGRKQPQKVISLLERRKLRRLFEMITDSRYDERDYLEAIRDLGPQEGTPEFLYFVQLWHDYRGRF